MKSDTLIAPTIARINGVALNTANEDITPDELRQRIDRDTPFVRAALR